MFSFRAWLPIDQCFLITENNCKSKSKNSKSKFDAALKELNEHISKIESKFQIKFPFADSAKVPVDSKKPFVKTPKKDGELSSEEEEEDFLDDIDGPGLQIDESVKEAMDDESESKQTSPKNGSGELSEPDVTPQKLKSAKKRKLSSVKPGNSEESRSKKAPPIKETPPPAPDVPKAVRSPSSAISDPTEPVEQKDTATLMKEVEKWKAIAKEEKDSCIEQLRQERKRAEIAIAEAKKEFAKEKDKAVREARARLEATHATAIAETKKQQWCAQCAQPAVYYCCWNTSYCSYDCQNNHWQIHMNSCQQSRQTQHTVR